MVEIPMLHDTPDGAEYLIQQIDALKAENERLTRIVEVEGPVTHWKTRAEAAERALAERAGGVKGEWHRADGDKSILLYTLRQDGWRKGDAVMVNDVTVRIEAANGSESPIEPIASAILSTLTTEPAAPATSCYECGHELNGPYCPKCRPAAPEGRQGDGHTDADGYPYEYPRPTEQAVTEAQGWRPIDTAPKDEEVLIAYWRWRSSMSPGSIVVQSASQTEFHGEGVWSWVVSDNKHGPFPIRGWSEGDIIGWQPLPTPPVNQSEGADRG